MDEKPRRCPPIPLDCLPYGYKITFDKSYVLHMKSRKFYLGNSKYISCLNIIYSLLFHFLKIHVVIWIIQISSTQKTVAKVYVFVTCFPSISKGYFIHFRPNGIEFFFCEK